jgi:hypothetical protein
MSPLRQTDLEPVFCYGEPLIWRRNERGELLTNVPRRVIHHSPTGWEIGYSGSGPADLALNAMAALFPASDHRRVKCHRGVVSRRAWLLHQPFKLHYLAHASREAGCIVWPSIAAWLEIQPQEDQP